MSKQEEECPSVQAVGSHIMTTAPLIYYDYKGMTGLLMGQKEQHYSLRSQSCQSCCKRRLYVVYTGHSCATDGSTG